MRATGRPCGGYGVMLQMCDIPYVPSLRRWVGDAARVQSDEFVIGIFMARLLGTRQLIIDELTEKMMPFPYDRIMLNGVMCRLEEIWLMRVA